MAVRGCCNSVVDNHDLRVVTVWGLLVNVCLAVFKFVFGLFGDSQALIADGVHSLSDTTTDIAVLIGVKYWSAPADRKHPHGHGRIETLITLFIGLALGAVGVGLAYKAVITLYEHQSSSPRWYTLVVAVISIISKEFLYRWTVRVGRRVKSSALMANAWHHRSDALSSVPVAVAILVTKLHPAWGFLDHVAAILVAVMILHAVWRICVPAINELIDAAADQQSRDKLFEIALNTPGVKSVHALRTRHIGPGLGVDLHVLVDENLNIREGHNISGRVKERLLKLGPDVIDVLVHIEPFEADHN